MRDLEGRAGVGDGESARAGPPGVGNMSVRRAPNFPAVSREEPEGHRSDETFVTHFYLAHWLFHLRALKLKPPWGGFTRSPFPRPPRTALFRAVVPEPLHVSFHSSGGLPSTSRRPAFTHVAHTLPPPGSLP